MNVNNWIVFNCGCVRADVFFFNWRCAPCEIGAPGRSPPVRAPVGSVLKKSAKAKALPTGTDCHCGVHVYSHRKSCRKVIDIYDEGAGKMRKLRERHDDGAVTRSNIWKTRSSSTNYQQLTAAVSSLPPFHQYFRRALSFLPFYLRPWLLLFRW